MSSLSMSNAIMSSLLNNRLRLRRRRRRRRRSLRAFQGGP